VDWAIAEKHYSQRQACGLIGMAPKTYRYIGKRDGDEAVREPLRPLASERRRFGYRRLHALLAREGMRLNRKKLYRLYREERLAVRRRQNDVKTANLIVNRVLSYHDSDSSSAPWRTGRLGLLGRGSLQFTRSVGERRAVHRIPMPLSPPGHEAPYPAFKK
jgi:hypothetical protein